MKDRYRTSSSILLAGEERRRGGGAGTEAGGGEKVLACLPISHDHVSPLRFSHLQALILSDSPVRQITE